jgi:hypothetical protein
MECNTSDMDGCKSQNVIQGKDSRILNNRGVIYLNQGSKGDCSYSVG